MLVSVLVILTPFSISIHLNIPILFSASFGWSINTIVMKEITKFLIILFIHLGLMRYTITQIIETAKNIMKGSQNRRKSLKTSLELKGPLISLSLIKQSILKNVSVDPPSLLKGMNILFIAPGYPELILSDTVVN